MEDSLSTHKEDMIFRFVCTEQGIYVHNTDEINFVMLNTVRNNITRYHQRQIKGEETARDTYGKFGYPSLNDFSKIVRMNLIRNLLVKISNIEIALR